MNQQREDRSHGVVLELSKLTVRALRELGHVGAKERERACELAGQAWALLHRDHADAAERMNGVLHYLTGPRFEKAIRGGSADTNGNGGGSASPSPTPTVAGMTADVGEPATGDGASTAAGMSADGHSTTSVKSTGDTHMAWGVQPVESEHPWLPAPASLQSRAEVEAYYDEVRGKAALGNDFDMEVRHLIPADRHTIIIEVFNLLRSGQGFVLVNDHDPKPLYYQFAFEYADRFTWDPIEEGPEVWRVRIGRR